MRLYQVYGLYTVESDENMVHEEAVLVYLQVLM
jgi:hypothetical protein